MPTVEELVILMLWDDPGKTLDEIYAPLARGGLMVTKVSIIRLIVDMKKRGLVRFLYQQGWPETRFALEQEGYAMAAINLGALEKRVGWPIHY
ncbi:MAG: hypothetical protein AAB731_00725 [Patescibacteria group bacterium]|mgnify:FL=1